MKAWRSSSRGQRDEILPDVAESTLRFRYSTPRSNWDRYALALSEERHLESLVTMPTQKPAAMVSRRNADERGGFIRAECSDELRRLRAGHGPLHLAAGSDRDRKSTRLNSSHLGISYAVFCLKKKIK